ncbi:unnamed protein product [Paramecium primaurelia]|uniref:Uncharacterized protein n=1 Tax=Paramecium primaurelia TaxID=5886 RepID=A0A8S1M6H2_PARPR|nr:unnamed protein product [Paramecium primaurelia]
MKLLLFFLFEYLDFAPLPAADANAKFSQKIFIFQEKHLLFGEITKIYKQVFFFAYSFIIQWSTTVFSKKNDFLDTRY